MNRIRLLFTGLVVIVLALAAGTGWLIYERVESEVAPAGKATKQEVRALEQRQDATEATDRKQDVDIEALRKTDERHDKELAVAGGERADLRAGQSKLESENSELKKEVGSLKEELAKALAALAALTTRQDAADAKSTELEKAIKELKDQISELRKLLGTEPES